MQEFRYFFSFLTHVVKVNMQKKISRGWSTNRLKILFTNVFSDASCFVWMCVLFFNLPLNCHSLIVMQIQSFVLAMVFYFFPSSFYSFVFFHPTKKKIWLKSVEWTTPKWNRNARNDQFVWQRQQKKEKKIQSITNKREQ